MPDLLGPAVMPVYLVLDEAGRVVKADQAADRLLGRSVVGEPLSSLVSEVDRPRVPSLLRWGKRGMAQAELEIGPAATAVDAVFYAAHMGPSKGVGVMLTPAGIEPAPTLPSPSERQVAFESAELLGEPAGHELDKLTALATQIVGAPVSLVTLVDVQRGRQVFKSATGLGEPWASAGQTPLSHSFCQHVAATSRPLIVSDAREHPLVQENQAIEDLSVVAYLGIPIRAADGTPIGSFCAIDSEPRVWTAEEQEMLTTLAEAATSEIALRYHRDVAERAQRRLQAQSAQLETIFDSLPIALTLIDADARILRVNRSEEHVAELDRAALEGRSMKEIVPNAWQVIEPLFAQALATGEPAQDEYVPILSSGTRHMRITVVPLPDGAGGRAVIIAEDVTDAHEAEQMHLQNERALNLVVQGLKQASARDQEQLRQLAKDAATAEQRERERIASLLHDELQQVLYAATMRLTQAARRAPDTTASELEAIKTSLTEAVELTRGLAIELDPPVVREGTLSDALAWLADQMSRRHGLAVSLDVPDQTDAADRAQRILLFRAVRELLFNVVKHAGTPEARVSAETSSDKLVVEVSDAGHGFDLDATPRGIGMRAVQERVRVSGGTLEIDSAVGKGSRFRFTVPLPKAARRRAEARLSGRVHRIALVEDNPVVRKA
ncbi:MAG: PAS domain-containing protein, partial [Bacteroidota bacterium]